MSDVTVEIARTATFIYDLGSAPNYRHIEGGWWLPEEILRADPELYERASGYSLMAVDLADRILRELIPDFLGESGDHPMGPWIQVNLVECPWSVDQIRAAIQALVDHLRSGAEIRSNRAPRQTADDTYWDPTTKVKFIPPAAVVQALSLTPRDST